MSPESSLYHYKADVVSVYDGDTIRVDIDLGCNTWLRNEPIRLYGINTPELRGEERQDGLRSRDYLRGRIDGKRVMLRTHKDRSGKYGRLLAVVYIEDRSGWTDVNDEMIEGGWAQVYG